MITQFVGQIFLGRLMDMGFLGIGEKKADEETKVEETATESGGAEGKYNVPCAVCNKAPCDKHWAGQYFHKKCLRKIRKGAKGML